MSDIKFHRSGFFSRMNSKNSTFYKFCVIPAIPLSIMAIASTDPTLWITTDVDHFYFEIIGVIFNAVIACYCFYRSIALNDRLFLFLAMGFVASGTIDLLHALVSYGSVGQTSFLDYFIPQTWAAGRIIDSCLMILAFSRLMGSKNSEMTEPNPSKMNYKKITRTNITIIYLVGSASLCAFVFSLVVPFPHVIVDSPIPRPYDMVDLVLFVIAMVLFYKNGFIKMNDVFYKGIATFMIISIFGQAIISFSATNFDTPFNVAHLLKDVGYFVIIISMILSSIFGYVRLKERELVISKQNKLLGFQNSQIISAEKKYRNLYENSPDLYLIINFDGKIIDCNRSFADNVGYPKHEIICKSIFNHVPEEGIYALFDTFNTWRQNGVISNKEIMLRKKDGTIFLVLLSANNLYDEKGQIVGCNAMMRDISELRDAQNQVEELRTKRLSVIGELTSRIAHDLRNPLSVIKNSVEIMKINSEKNTHNNDDTQFLSMLERATDRLSHQINDVLDYVRMSPSNKTSTQLSALLKRAKARTNLRDDIKYNFPKEDYVIRCDPEKMEVVFVNLFTNASQAMKSDDGQINVIVKNHDDYIQIKVQDRGSGIPKKIISRIFEPLYTTKQKGTGLGLASCKNIIEQHGGYIEAKNITLGDQVGAEFTITLTKILEIKS